MYGEPIQRNPYIEDYAWLGDRMTIIYSKNSITDNTRIDLWSKSMQAFEEAEKEKAAKKAAADL